jgi:hypothetical protein
MVPVVLAADAPQPSWAGILTAVALVVLNVGGLVTAISLAMNRRRDSERRDAREKEESKRLDAYQQDTTGRLDVIRTLVDGTLTTALQDALDASRRELVAQLELVDLQLNWGTPPTEDRLATIGALRRRVGELSAQMQDREAQIRSADIQIANEAARIAERDA